MSTTEIIAFIAGAVVGVALIAVLVYRLLKKKNNTVDEEMLSSEEFRKRREERAKKKEKLDDLLKGQSYVDVLSIRELTDWFRESSGEFKGAQMIITKPDRQIIGELGYDLEEEIDSNKNVIQLFYDSEKREVLKIRLVNFSEMDEALSSKINEEDGMIVVTD